MPKHPLTIVFVTHEYPVLERLYGGIGVYVRILSRALLRLGHKIHVVTAAERGKTSVWKDGNIIVHHVGSFDPRNIHEPEHLKAFSLAVSNYIHALDKDQKIDIVEFGDWAAEGWAFKPRLGQVKVVRVHTPSFIVRKYENMSPCFSDNSIDELERSSLVSANLITSPSKLLAKTICAQWNLDCDSIQILPNPVDTESFYPMKDQMKKDNPMILCVNRYSPLKGIDILVRAAAIIHGKVPSAKFRFVGHCAADCNGMDAVRYLTGLARRLGLSDDTLCFAGRRLWADLPGEYRGADICVNPSLFESFSYTSAEALSCGRALILTDQQGIIEYLVDGVECLVTPSSNPQAVASTLLALIENPVFSRQIGDNARQAAENKFSINVVARNIEQLYQSELAISG